MHGEYSDINNIQAEKSTVAYDGDLDEEITRRV